MAASATSRDSHSATSLLELLLPALAVAARLPVPPAGGLELLFQPFVLRLWSAAGVFKLAAFVLMPSISVRKLLDLAFELGTVVA